MLFHLVLLTAPASLLDEPRLLAELLMLPTPPYRLHLRKPGWSAAQYETLIQALPKKTHAQLVLHAYPQLVSQYQLAGLHLTSNQRASQPRWPPLLPNQTLSTSFHSLAEINRRRRHYDYVFLSPIFDSISKSGYASRFELPTLQVGLQKLATRSGHRSQVLALGGIDNQNLALVRQLGFAGAAVLGGVWQSADPIAAWQRLVLIANQQ